jgi:hypothetical protein
MKKLFLLVSLAVSVTSFGQIFSFVGAIPKAEPKTVIRVLETLPQADSIIKGTILQDPSFFKSDVVLLNFTIESSVPAEAVFDSIFKGKFTISHIFSNKVVETGDLYTEIWMNDGNNYRHIEVYKSGDNCTVYVDRGDLTSLIGRYGSMTYRH